MKIPFSLAVILFTLFQIQNQAVAQNESTNDELIDDSFASYALTNSQPMVNATDFRFRVLHVYPEDRKPTAAVETTLSKYVKEVRKFYGRKLGKTFVLAGPEVAEHELAVSYADLYSGAKLSNTSRITSYRPDPGVLNPLRYILENFIAETYSEESDSGNDFIVLLDGVDDSVFVAVPGLALITDGALMLGALGAAILAHEVGHALGLYHTPTSASCLERNFGVDVHRPLSDHALMQPTLSSPKVWDALRGKDIESYSLLDFEESLLMQVDYPVVASNSTICLSLIGREHPAKYLSEEYEAASGASSLVRANMAAALAFMHANYCILHLH